MSVLMFIHTYLESLMQHYVEEIKPVNQKQYYYFNHGLGNFETLSVRTPFRYLKQSFSYSGGDCKTAAL